MKPALFWRPVNSVVLRGRRNSISHLETIEELSQHRCHRWWQCCTTNGLGSDHQQCRRLHKRRRLCVTQYDEMLAIRMRDPHESKWNQDNRSRKNNAPVVQIAQWAVQIAQTLSRPARKHRGRHRFEVSPNQVVVPQFNRLSLSVAGAAAVALTSLPLGITPANASKSSESAPSIGREGSPTPQPVDF
jgi:hypothetical protein